MRGLSLWQPWASAIAFGAKSIETRSWGTDYTGPLLICSTAKTALDEFEYILDDDLICAVLLRRGIVDHLSPISSDEARAALKRLPHGAALAVANLVGCYRISGIQGASDPKEIGEITLHLQGRGGASSHTLSWTEHAFGHYSIGRYVWLLSDIQPLPQPIPCRGAQGLWSVSPDLEAQILGVAPRPPAPAKQKEEALCLSL